MPRIDLVGVPYTSMARPGGIADAIGVLRSRGLAERLEEIGVRDRGDLRLEGPSGERGPTGLLNEDALRGLISATREAVAASRARDRKALLVGGDCPVLLGPLAALTEADGACGLVMLDGHEDAWPPLLSETGEASDSELGLAIGRFGTEVSNRIGIAHPLVDPSSVALLGPRDAEEILAAGVRSVRGDVAMFMDDREVARAGGAGAVRAAIDRVGGPAFWLHVDLDVLDTASFGAVDYPQPGGLSWRELDDAVGTAIADPHCRGASIAIYDPDLDPHRTDAERLIDFLTRSIAGSRAPGAGDR